MVTLLALGDVPMRTESCTSSNEKAKRPIVDVAFGRRMRLDRQCAVTSVLTPASVRPCTWSLVTCPWRFAVHHAFIRGSEIVCPATTTEAREEVAGRAHAGTGDVTTAHASTATIATLFLIAASFDERPARPRIRARQPRRLLASPR